MLKRVIRKHTSQYVAQSGAALRMAPFLLMSLSPHYTEAYYGKQPYGTLELRRC